jgi:hypothetical protein
MKRIEVDEEVFAAMQAEALAFVDQPNDVLRRKFGLGKGPRRVAANMATSNGKSRAGTGGKRKQPRAPRGELLAAEAYEPEVLKVLAANGGEAAAREATDAVEALIGDRLSPLDYEKTSSGEIRWRNRTQFARLALVKKGLIDKDAPRGTWRLTDEGRKAARSARPIKG